MRRKFLAGAAVAAAVAALAACAPADGSEDGTGDTVDLTLWIYGACDSEECLEADLVAGFEQDNPGVTIEIVSQPPDNYFAALQSASVTGSGPDLAFLWPGAYLDPFKKYLLDAHEFVDSELIQESSGTAYFSEGNDNSAHVYAIPTNNQYYIGFYNKRIFEEHGLTPPTTWDELNQVCQTLKEAGVLPIISGATSGSAQFQPLTEWSFLAATFMPSQWSDLYDGTMPYNNPELQHQLEEWASLYESGYMNEDAFNAPDVDDRFAAGDAAMWFSGGSWQIPSFVDEMGEDLGVFQTPYLDESRPLTVVTAGTGYGVTTYSEHPEEAGAFLEFILSDAGQQIIADSGQPPTRPGFDTGVPAMDALAEAAAAPETVLYPMFDNFTQGPVTDAIYSDVALVLVGQMAPEEALASVDAAFASLPEDEQNIDIPLSDTK
ncbi:ABC transporter substrate-binding protein [Occultella kanbiaonis]|uniref:ABC transporter substrate-binding protein n=1 Tax=Occultella kanbiaonis TaxID=2675754 RepID=UPI0013D6BEA3|nr:extracellular solute-binding protein [Occultella kanbiaonis]